MSLLSKIWIAPRSIKRLISVFVDLILISIAYWGAYWTRLQGVEAYLSDDNYRLIFLVTLVITILIFVQVGLYRAILRYMDSQAILFILLSACLSALVLVLVSYFIHAAVPRSIPVIYCAYIIILCGGARLVARMLINRSGAKQKTNVIIYGAGSAGRQLTHILQQGSEYRPVCFIDDCSKLHRSSVHGLTIYSSKSISRQVSKHQVKKILLAMPSATNSQRKKIVQSLSEFAIEVLSIPDLDDIANGLLTMDQFKDVSIEDLLGRNAVVPDQQLMEQNIKGKSVLVTGAGGSIGAELCRQIISVRPRELILFEQSEFSLYSIENELRYLIAEIEVTINLVPILGSVQNKNRLDSVMSSFSVNTVFHAAAYKHVPLVEYNVVEGVRNNIFGTLNCAQAAVNAKVDSFVLISTDKAVRPTNVMGASKRVAELVLQSMSCLQRDTSFKMVRFGNVLGSSGSVVPLFRQQIKAGGPVTVTHPDITRYFMTIPEAAQLVIQAGSMGAAGDVFVLDMGDSVKIVDLATKMIHLSGFSVKTEFEDGDIEITFSGLRPGEKLYEELLIGDNVSGTAHPRIMTASEEMLDWPALSDFLERIDLACKAYDLKEIRELLMVMPTGFNPSDAIGDLLWNKIKQEQLLSKKVSTI
ncbi:MAG: UDP-D-quinovosamine 4-dehydrogenase [Osedax symbiont Rs1]|nr:MAG: UDP-D-quinovosamine 4-dehydrogenase [Osedax symbiont Rs1]